MSGALAMHRAGRVSLFSERRLRPTNSTNVGQGGLQTRCIVYSRTRTKNMIKEEISNDVVVELINRCNCWPQTFKNASENEAVHFIESQRNRFFGS